MLRRFQFNRTARTNVMPNRRQVDYADSVP